MRVIKGKRALITGAASGIGRAIALGLAREGADVWLLDVDENGLAEVVAESRAFGVEAIGVRCDVSRPLRSLGASRSYSAPGGIWIFW